MNDPKPAETPSVIQAHRFELIGRTGAVRAVLGELPNPDDTPEPVVGLGILDGDGRPRTWLALLPTGPSLTFDQDGVNALEMGVDDPTADALRTGPYLYLAAPDGRELAGWRVDEDGSVTAIAEGTAR